MKKIMFLAWITLATLNVNSQIQTEGTDQMGKLQDVTYDAFIPNRLYALTYGNHLVESNDNGISWHIIYSYPGTAFIKGLKMLPGNNSLSFVANTDIIIFDLVTHTVTTTIQVPQSGIAGAGVSTMSSYHIYNSTAKIMLVDTRFKISLQSYGKTFYTNNGGDTWTEVYFTANHDNVFINTVAIHPTQSNKIYLGRGNGDTDIDGGLWISTTLGQSWTQTLTDTTVGAIGFNPDNPNDVLAGAGIGYSGQVERLYRSFNGGQNWSIVPVTWSDGILDNVNQIKFNPNNSDEIIVLEENEIVRSFDNGDTWSNLVYSVYTAEGYYYGLNASFNPFDENQLALSTDLYPLLMDKTTAAFTLVQSPCFFTLRNAVVKYDDNVPHLYYDAQGGIFHKNINSSMTSVYDIQPANTFNVRRNSVIPDKSVPGRLFSYAGSGFMGGSLKMSTDYGSTFTDIYYGFYEDMPVLKTRPFNNNILYFSLRSGGSGSLYKADLTDPSNIQVTELMTPALDGFEQGYVTSLVIDANTSALYIAKGSHFYTSTDDGITWTESTNGLEELVPDSDAIWDVEANPFHPEELTMATTRGAFMSNDSGASWYSIIPQIEVSNITYSPYNEGLIVASMYSTEDSLAQIAYSVNHGADWTVITPEELQYVQSYCMDYDFDGNIIKAYLATTDLGVVSYVITDVPLSINQPEVNNSGVSLYPNPVSTTLTAVADGYMVTKLKVYNTTGQLIKTTSSAELDMTSLSSGLYLVEITTNNEKKWVKRIVKK